MTNLKKLVLLLACLPVLCAHAATSKKDAKAKQEAIDTASQAVAAPQENRIVRYTYSPDLIFRIYTEPKLHTDIELGEDEGLTEKPVLGDTIEWKVSGGPTHLYVKPVRDDINTSMTVVTNKRVYQLQLIARQGGPVFQKVSFDYPDAEADLKLREETVAARETAVARVSAEQIVAENTDPADYDFAYEIKGDAPFRPTAVYANKQFTLVRLPPVQDLPAVFLVDDDGKMSLVNFNTATPGVIKIERVAKHLLLVLGDQKITIDHTEPRKHIW